MTEFWRRIKKAVVDFLDRFIIWRKAEKKYRVSLGIKCSIANRKFGFLLQAWSVDDEFLESLSDKLEKKFLELLEDFLEYPEDDFWFVYMLGRGLLEEGDWSEEVLERWEWRVTMRGLVIEYKSGELDAL